MTKYRLLPAADAAPADLHHAFAAAFADYVAGPFALSLEGWPVFLARQGVDLALSRAAVAEGKVLAFAFTAPRTDVAAWRLAGMGALPAARGSGAARDLLDDFVERARGAQCTWAELECFAQNERALRLYAGRGFEALHELHGHGGRPQPAACDACMQVDLRDAFGWIEAMSRRRGDLPLQVTPTALRALPEPLQSWRCGQAQAVVAAGTPGKLTVFSLLDDGSPSQTDALALVRHLAAAYPEATFGAPQLQRPDLGGEALARAGLARLPLHQVFMRKRLAT